jgi:hypothetical protein
VSTFEKGVVYCGYAYTLAELADRLEAAATCAAETGGQVQVL